MRYGNVELHNVCEIIEGDGEPGFGMSRLPRDIREKINQGARTMSMMGAGCEIRGMLPEGGQARVVLQAIDSNTTPPIATVYHGCFCGQSILVAKEPTEIIINDPPNMAAMSRISSAGSLPFNPRLVRVRFPPIHTVRVVSIEGDLTYPVPGAAPAKTLLCYGSSITHGACAIPPEGTYVSQCARRLGCDLINLGFGGSAQMDRAIADHIASRKDWDLATFEMGINVREWPRERFREAVEMFVGAVVSAHPEKYIFCIDLFTNDVDFEDHPTKGVGFREVVRDVAGQFSSGKVIHVDGRTILTDPTGLRTDLVHPSDEGMQEMGDNLASIISRYCCPGSRKGTI
jgi:lysophospholipase L1-like esterase